MSFQHTIRNHHLWVVDNESNPLNISIYTLCNSSSSSTYNGCIQKTWHCACFSINHKPCNPQWIQKEWFWDSSNKKMPICDERFEGWFNHFSTLRYQLGLNCVNGSSQIHHHIGKSVFQFKLNARILVLPNKYQYRKKPVKETTEVHSQDNQNGLALLERYSLEFALLKAYSID